MPARETLTLTTGSPYSVRTIGGALFRRVRWHYGYQAFMLNAYGGIPFALAYAISDDEGVSWFCVAGEPSPGDDGA
jgi:hypothetical protein